MTPRNLGNMYTCSIAVKAHFHINPALKFLHATGETSWSLLTGSASLLSGATVQPKITYSCIHKMTGESKKKDKHWH